MITYYIETEGGKTVNEFFKNAERQLKSKDLKFNPFNGGVVRPVNKYVWRFSINPVFPNVSFYGFIWLAVSITFNFPLFWIVLPAAILFAQAIMFYNRTWYLLNKLGLRKAGYKGSVKYLSYKKVLERYL